MIEFGKRIVLNTPAGTISLTGIASINNLIAAQNLQSDDWKALNTNSTRIYLPPLPDDWQWVWVVAKGEFAGTMPKRIAKYYYKAHGLKSPASFLQEIGNRARRHSSDHVIYTFDFTREFDWQAGAYGDGGSYFWGSNAHALDMLSENNALAIRFYDSDGRGFARAWIADLVSSENFYILFNGYGFDGNSTLTAARIFATHLTFSYKKISLTNYDRSSGTLWINGGIGYAIGAVEHIDGVSSFDLEWEDPEMATCERCGDSLGEDDIFYGADDMPYCQDCFYILFDNCSLCGETYWQEDITLVGDDYVCPRCLERNFARCSNCGEYARTRDMQYDEKEEAYFCRNCQDAE